MMRNVFLILLAALVAASQAMTMRKTGDAPAGGRIYWSTVINPMHNKYTVLFRQWVSNQPGAKDVMVSVDVNSQGKQKTVIQGVSGVAADVLTVHNFDVPFYESIGILQDLEVFPDLAAQVRSNLARTPEISYYLLRGDHLYGVPMRIHANAYMMNLDAIRALGMPDPPFSPSVDQFEAMAKDFCARGNKGKTRRDVFFADRVGLDLLLHAAGLSFINETGTAAAAFDENRRRLMDRYISWVYEDHIIPTPAEWASFNVDQNYSPAFSLFCRNQFAAIRGGRWFAIFMRQVKKPVTMGTMLPPHSGYPVTDFVFGGISMYRNSPRKEQSAWYLRYFLSSNYNRELARDSDGLPPDTRYWNDPELLRPSKWTNEWAFHEPYTNIFFNHSCAPEDSPFVQATQFDRSRGQFGYWDTRHKGAQESWELFAAYFADELKRNLKHKPAEKPAYEAAVKRQAEIDKLKAEGKKIPLDWVANPYLRKYYRDSGKGI